MASGNMPGTCSMCKKKPGLPIFLARYTIARNASKAPKLSKSFKASKESISLGKETDYTLRILRPGYVYVYDPANKESPWKGYIVTANALLYPFHIGEEGPTPQGEVKIDHTCVNPNDSRPTAMAITIENAENCKEVWIGYSEVEWTNNVWKRYNDNVEECRDKTMRKFNVKAWLNSPRNTEHAALTAEMEGQITECCEAIVPKEFAFSVEPLAQINGQMKDWGKLADEIGAKRPADPKRPTAQEMIDINAQHSKKQEEYRKRLAEVEKERDAVIKDMTAKIAESTKNRNGPTAKEIVEKEGAKLHKLDAEKKDLESRLMLNTYPWSYFSTWHTISEKLNQLSTGKAKGKAAVLALDDAQALTADLASLLSARVDAFHAHFYSDEKRLRELKAGMNILALREQIRENAIKKMDHKLHTRADIMAPSTAEVMTEEEFNECIADAYENAWKPYEAYYDDQKIFDSQTEHTEALAKFNKNELSDLVKAHAAWLESRGMTAPMQYHYDEENIHCGLVYALAVSKSVGATQEMVECEELYEKWLEGDPTDRTNFYLRAFLLNQQEDIEQAKKFAEEAGGKSFTEQKKFWDKLTTDSIKQGMRIVGDSLGKKTFILSRLIAQASGPMLAKYQGAVEMAIKSGKMPFWMGVMAKVNGGPMPPVTVSTTKKGGGLFFAGKALENMARNAKANLGKNASQNFKTSFKFPSNGFADVVDARKQVWGADHTSKANRHTHIYFPIDMEVYEKEMKKIPTTNMKKDQIQLARENALKKALDAGNNKGVGATVGDTIKGAGKNIHTLVNTNLNFIFQYASLCSLLKAYEKEESKDSELRSQSADHILAAKCWQWGFASFTAAMDFTTTAMEWSSKTGLKFAQGPVFEKVTKFVKGSARVLGTAAAGVSAYVDAMGVYKAEVEGKTGLRNAYLASFGISSAVFAITAYTTFTYFFSAAGVATTILGVSITGILLVLAAAAILVMIWVMEETRKANIKEWLLHCIFGKEEKREELRQKTGISVKEYSSLSVEEAALKLVFS